MAVKVPTEATLRKLDEKRIEVYVTHDYNSTRRSIVTAANASFRHHGDAYGTWKQRVKDSQQIDPGPPGPGVEFMTKVVYIFLRP